MPQIRFRSNGAKFFGEKFVQREEFFVFLPQEKRKTKKFKRSINKEAAFVRKAVSVLT